jgi:hypothetical protein
MDRIAGTRLLNSIGVELELAVYRRTLRRYLSKATETVGRIAFYQFITRHEAASSTQFTAWLTL